MKCLKETDSVPTHTLLTTIELEGEVVAMRMNETRIVCLRLNLFFFINQTLRDENIYVVDLKPVDRLRCPEPC